MQRRKRSRTHSVGDKVSKNSGSKYVPQPEKIAAAASGDTLEREDSIKLSNTVLRSLAIAPDVSGIRCVAVHPSEREIVLARENGSLILYAIERFQNVTHFQMLRSTGGRKSRTITRLRYLTRGTGNSKGISTRTAPLLLASYLSGQFVVYCGDTLAPLCVHQRTGGAIWDFCITDHTVYAAKADGSWHQLHVEYSSNVAGAAGSRAPTVPVLTLKRIIPKVPGADRAISVCCSRQWGIVAGTDDAGNVVAWRLPRPESTDDRDEETSNQDNRGGEGNTGTAGDRPQSLTEHEALWTSRLPEGMALCCTISTSSKNAAPVVAVGTSVGDVVIFEATRGQAVKTFTHHKGPISSLVSCQEYVSGNQCGVIYASGWHESLRSYRCSVEGEWRPAEVKRRTHHHETSELALLHRHQIILSASRDATVMYSPTQCLFSAPAMYLHTTCQKLAFAKERNVLLQTRSGRIEGFCTDAALRRWSPLFGYEVKGKFHLQGLWCDDSLGHIVFSTDERVSLLCCRWRNGLEGSLALKRIEEVRSLPAKYGIIDCCFVNTKTNKSCYLLFDDAIVQISLTKAYPVVTTQLVQRDGDPDEIDICPTRFMWLENRADVGEEEGTNHTKLMVYGRRGWLSCSTAVDGTIDTSTFTVHREVMQMVESVPHLSQSQGRVEHTIVALANGERYVAGIGTSQLLQLPRSLPHDTRFVALLPPRRRRNDSGNEVSEGLGSGPRFLATFSRGLLWVTRNSWCMLSRCSAEGAFVLRGNKKVLIVVRNLEGTLEVLPPCWRLRRFGN
ncbi:hypothetical protein DPX39_030015000 [Trypanosoma brucei equiperdum]|uniref:WD domain n=1 Tax=Trypanosoma brucei equiperdum TaxID=630700 RepID=A0A3L6LAZ6_9TRYP|nr:hypothetical protein DPX39_030015000 [Trypanosoma brucei equiperdum]